jgi:hypothetical protein
MHRVLVLLLTLVFLPVLCRADSIDVVNYQINISATWIETNPACVSNCTENMNISYVFELNTNPNPTSGAFGWVDLSTLKESSSGFLGSFAFTGSTSGLWEDDLEPSVDALEFHNSLSANPDEIDLGQMGPGLTNVRNGSPDMYIYDCFSETCLNAYSPPYQYIQANSESSTAVPVPAGDSVWILLVSAIACTFGFFVKQRSA